LEGFKKIIWRYGNLLKLDPEAMEQSRLDVARAQIAVTYWEMVDEVIEVKVNDEIFVIRMVEERFGGVDVGVNKVAGSRTGVGESSGDSVSMDHEGRSVVGIEEGWSENQSDAGVSVNDGDRLGVVDKHGEPTGINQRVDEKVVSEEVREGDFEKAADKEGVKGVNTEVSEWDVDFVGSRVGENGSGGSEVMETFEGLAQEQGLGSHVNLECVVVEDEKVEEEGQQILASG
jgi:hypothetical protein